jgi:hypothetical protein
LILGGKPGRGKTYLAVAIAYRAIQNGFHALFVTAAELIDDLSAAFAAVEGHARGSDVRVPIVVSPTGDVIHDMRPVLDAARRDR